MEWIKKISYYQNIRNEGPNKELAEELARDENLDGIKEIAQYLYDKNRTVASDCLAVMYHVGYTRPDLIVDYADRFLDLLGSPNNRMVWGSMIALANISVIKADLLYENLEKLLSTIQKGSLITEVWGIKALAGIAGGNKKYKKEIIPVLLYFLKSCRPVDFAARVAVVLPVFTEKAEKIVVEKIVAEKVSELTPAQKKKLEQVMKNSDGAG